MKNLQGPRGLKGEPGDRGLPGKDDKCGCSTSFAPGYEGDGFSIDDADRISTKTIGFGVDDSIDVDFDIPYAPADLQGKFGTVMVGDSVDFPKPLAIEEQAGKETRVVAAPSPVSVPLTVDPSITKESLIARLETSKKNIGTILNEAEEGKSDYMAGKVNLEAELEGLIGQITSSGGTDAELAVLKSEVDKTIIRPFYFDMNSLDKLLTNDDLLRAFHHNSDPYKKTEGTSYMFQLADINASINPSTKRIYASKNRENYFNIKVDDSKSPTIVDYYGANYQTTAKQILVPGKEGDTDCYPFYQVFYDLEKKQLIPIADVDQAIIDAANIQFGTWKYQCPS